MKGEKIAGGNGRGADGRFLKGNPGSGGRPLGSKNVVPAGFKATARTVCQEIESVYGGDVLQALLDGIRAGPPKSAAYLTLFFNYRDGRPKEFVTVDTPQAVVFEYATCRHPECRTGGGPDPGDGGVPGHEGERCP